jgi:hypothetical protein
MSAWTHPVCDTCFAGLYGDRQPVRMKEEYRDDEACALCRKTTRSGIYIRLDPKELSHESRPQP